MAFLLVIVYIAFISLGVPDSLIGAAWPAIYPDMQMPVEECGNMLLCVAALCYARKDLSYFKKHGKILKQWADYLIKAGYDPENQLCTDDFAGHLAHNCNLSLKAIMGIMGLSIIYSIAGDEKNAAKYKRIARKKAKSWCERAKNTADGSYRLTFDLDGSFSMKYNMVWDKIWGTKLFSDTVYRNETESYLGNFGAVGIDILIVSAYALVALVASVFAIVAFFCFSIAIYKRML